MHTMFVGGTLVCLGTITIYSKLPQLLTLKFKIMVYGKVNWFEIPVKNLMKAKAFYEEVFNVELTYKKEPSNIEMAIFPFGSQNELGAPGALVAGPFYTPTSDGTLIYFACEDVNNELKRVEVAGGKILLKKIDIGENGYIAHCLDIEGNRIGLHSMK